MVSSPGHCQLHPALPVWSRRQGSLLLAQAQAELHPHPCLDATLLPPLALTLLQAHSPELLQSLWPISADRAYKTGIPLVRDGVRGGSRVRRAARRVFVRRTAVDFRCVGGRLFLLYTPSPYIYAHTTTR